jgi:hypothetical protein
VWIDAALGVILRRVRIAIRSRGGIAVRFFRDNHHPNSINQAAGPP